MSCRRRGVWVLWLPFVHLECAIRNTGKYSEMGGITGSTSWITWNRVWRNTWAECAKKEKRSKEERDRSHFQMDRQHATGRYDILEIQIDLTAWFLSRLPWWCHPGPR